MIKRLLVILIWLFCASVWAGAPQQMLAGGGSSILRTQAVLSASTSSVAISSTNSGDVIVAFAYRNASSTIPSLPTGFTSIATNTSSGGTNPTAMRVGYKISAGGDTSCGTWTNANAMVCMVYRGLNQITPIGGHGTATGVGLALTYASVTMTNSSGSSWIAGFGAINANNDMSGSTPLLTNRISGGANTNGLDSGVGLTAYSGEVLTLTPNPDAWLTATLELLAP